VDTAEIEKLCKSLKGTTKDIKWGNDLCYSVGKKMYCVTSLKGDQSISFKTSEEIFGELIERDGIIPAPYAARYYWVLIQDLKAIRTKELKQCIQESYRMVFEKLPKKLQESILKGR
jgi:predicted DNA-binding protein (MmcQ/YjbR family)